ncbi:hypothetical protein Dsin_018293 [Dipteronia sinensis]|uniref:Uncharacterized protein n=1 Tax=Dipteronia sinensis TaxID=43782 RepID=A0AAE0A5M2_9ROSI|nr:hypothetical protein Dsin_018293 [Dipteronia sinensis]
MCLIIFYFFSFYSSRKHVYFFHFPRFVFAKEKIEINMFLIWCEHIFFHVVIETRETRLTPTHFLGLQLCKYYQLGSELLLVRWLGFQDLVALLLKPRMW